MVPHLLLQYLAVALAVLTAISVIMRFVFRGMHMTGGEVLSAYAASLTLFGLTLLNAYAAYEGAVVWLHIVLFFVTGGLSLYAYRVARRQA